MNMHIQIPQTSYVGLRVLCGYSDTTVTGATAHQIAAEYPHSTPTCSSHNGTALYETLIVGQEESGCVISIHPLCKTN